MSFPIPKIVYSALNTTISFQYPPIFSGDNPEELEIMDNVKFSLSGVRQSSLNYIDGNRYLTFAFASEALLASFETFIVSWASLGKAFQYYDDASLSSYVAYELAPGFKWKPTRITGVGGSTTDYIYTIPIQFRRTVGETSTAMITATIANNQVAAANVLGVVLDPTLYTSARIFCEINRKTSLSERAINGVLTAIYKTSTSTWQVSPSVNGEGDDPVVAFTMNGNQLQYTSDPQAGANYVGTIKILEMVFA